MKKTILVTACMGLGLAVPAAYAQPTASSQTAADAAAKELSAASAPTHAPTKVVASGACSGSARWKVVAAPHEAGTPVGVHFSGVIHQARPGSIWSGSTQTDTYVGDGTAVSSIADYGDIHVRRGGHFTFSSDGDGNYRHVFEFTFFSKRQTCLGRVAVPF